ncbi:MAG: RnfABCDGE type electron transport complex subunit D [Clostridia bacterium]
MENTNNNLLIASSPHIHSSNSLDLAMRDVLLALLPAVFAAILFFGLHSFLVITVCAISAVFAEFVAQKIMKRTVSISDGSAALTGVLLALCLPPSIPLWIAAIGAISAIIIGKQVFGGLGHNIFNPAHVGRAILLASWPVAMTTWTLPMAADAIASATPLALMKANNFAELPSLASMFLGNISGSIGETSALALLLGGAYLIWRGQIDWKIPASYLGTVAILTSIYGAINGLGVIYPFYHLFSGGLMIGAFFMATDWVTSPITKKGRLIFGICLGILTVLIRLKGGLNEGVCYSILIMNMATPLIDRYSKARIFGKKRKEPKHE